MVLYLPQLMIIGDLLIPRCELVFLSMRWCETYEMTQGGSLTILSSQLDFIPTCSHNYAQQFKINLTQNKLHQRRFFSFVFIKDLLSIALRRVNICFGSNPSDYHVYTLCRLYAICYPFNGKSKLHILHLNSIPLLSPVWMLFVVDL